METSNEQFTTISAQPELIALKESIPKSNEDLKNDNQTGRVFTGVVNESSRAGVSLRFLNGLKKLVLVKDLETVQDFPTIYTPGMVVRAALNKLDRLCLKESVIYLNDAKSITQDKVI